MTPKRSILAAVLFASTLLLVKRNTVTLSSLHEIIVEDFVPEEGININDTAQSAVAAVGDLKPGEGNAPDVATPVQDAQNKPTPQVDGDLATESPEQRQEEEKQTQSPQSTQQDQSTDTGLLSDRSALLTATGLKRQLEQAKINFQSRMKGLYGGYFETLFEPDGISIGHHFVHKSPCQFHSNSGKQALPDPDSKSWNALVRKLQIKLLQVQLGILKEQGQQLGGQPKTPFYAQYLWMTGGDSNAAGFGNLHHQTYTFVLQEAAREAFASVGIEFIARNHGLRGMESAPEVALCAGAIFGTDFDSLVWDFDAEDNKDIWQRALYAHRAAVSSRQRPALFFHGGALGKFHNQQTHGILANLERMGMPVLMNDPVVENTLLWKTPDCVDLSDEEVQRTLPPNLQFFRCGSAFEANQGKRGGRGTGRGHCTNYRHDHSVCKKRDMKDWFPGWKSHAVKGYSYAMTMIELLSHAVEVLGKEEDILPGAQGDDRDKVITQLETKLGDLIHAEERDYMTVMTSATLADPMLQGDIHQYINIASLSQSPALCRTLLMPSDTRLRGIFADKPAPYGQGHEEGVDMSTAQAVSAIGQNEGGRFFPLPFVTVWRERGPCREPGVESTQQKAFRDFYLATGIQDGWQGLTIPNNAEQQHYNSFDIEQSKGWIIMCFLQTKTKKSNLGYTLQKVGTEIQMQVNGKPVTGLREIFSNTCHSLQHEDGDPTKQFVWTPSSDGKYEFRVQNQNGIPDFKITSIILI